MKQNHILFTLAGLVLGISLFVAGRETATQTGTFNATGSPINQYSAKIERPNSGNTPINRPAKVSFRGGKSSDTSVICVTTEQMKEILAMTDNFASMQSWLKFVNNIKSDQFEEVVHEMRRSGEHAAQMEKYGLLLTAWAKVDPIAALQYAKLNTESNFASNTILATWVISEPELAIEWAKANHNGEEANPWFVGVIKGLVAYDIDRADKLFKEMPHSSVRVEALGYMLPYILAKGSEESKTWVRNIKDDDLRTRATNGICEDLTKANPIDTVNWLMENPEDEATQSSIDSVMNTWLDQNKEDAIAYYESMPAGEIRNKALQGIISRAAEKDPVEAVAIIESHMDDVNDKVYLEFVRNSCRKKPSLAMEYISRIQNLDYRNDTYLRTFSDWLRYDLDAASRWAQSANLPDDIHTKLELKITESRRNNAQRQTKPIH